MERLLQRARILQAIRGVMDEEFLEVQVPQLIRGTCPDLHIDSFRAGEGYLTTSTEYQLKRMFVGGFERLYTLTQNFREGDVGSHHNPEFAMLEWARAYASLDDIERDAERVVQRALASIAPGVTHITHGTYRVQLLGAPWERLSVRDALRRHLGIQIDPEFSLASMQAEVIRAGIEIPEVYRTNAVDLVTLLLDRMQPRLGAEVPTFLVDWPVFLTTSAPPFPDRPTLAQRSELFIAGIEVADGFPFLSDADRQTALFVAANAGRRGHGKPAVTLDDRYLAALREGLPPGAGMAMGVDRLVMLLVGEQDIRNVLPFAWDER
jgi:lysyl-tRNA synthetase class 2